MNRPTEYRYASYIRYTENIVNTDKEVFCYLSFSVSLSEMLNHVR